MKDLVSREHGSVAQLSRGAWGNLAKRTFGFALLLLLLSCGSPDRVLDIPIAVTDVSLSLANIGDYPEALVAIVSVMVHELNLPAPQGQVFFYHDEQTYRSAIIKELRASVTEFNKLYEVDPKVLERTRHQIEFDLVTLATTKAFTTHALVIRGKIFVGEWTLKDLPWSERVRVLAHELTHMIQYRLAEEGHIYPRITG